MKNECKSTKEKKRSAGKLALFREFLISNERGANFAKTSSGITLIALIITIIVLLILARSKYISSFAEIME